MVSSSCQTEKTSPVVLKCGGRGVKADPPKQEVNKSPMELWRSCRIQVKQKEEKELLVCRRMELLDDPNEVGDGKKTGTGNKRSRKDETVGNEEVVAKKQRVNSVLKSKESPRAKVEVISKIAILEERVDSENGGSNLVEKSDSLKVKEILRLFNKHYLHFVQEEEKRCTKAEADKKSSKKGSKSKLCDAMIFNHNPPRCVECGDCGGPKHCGMGCSALVVNKIGGYHACTILGRGSNFDVEVIDKKNPHIGVVVKMSNGNPKLNCSLSVSVLCNYYEIQGPWSLKRSGICDYFGEGALLQARFNYYSCSQRPDLVLGLKPHADGSGYTIIVQDDVEGLQVDKDGKSFTVPAIPHALLVLMGDQMEIMTNGVFKSPVHRVLTNRERERLSVAMFYTPEPNKEIGPKDDLVSEE